VKILAILFLINTIYYMFNRRRIHTSVKDRKYLSKLFVYLDISYFSILLFYYFWVISLAFINLHFFTFFICLGLIRWFLLKPSNPKIDYAFCILKLLLLFSFIIS
jgi:hypothetical protein